MCWRKENSSSIHLRLAESIFSRRPSSARRARIFMANSSGNRWATTNPVFPHSTNSLAPATSDVTTGVPLPPLSEYRWPDPHKGNVIQKGRMWHTKAGDFSENLKRLWIFNASGLSLHKPHHLGHEGLWHFRNSNQDSLTRIRHRTRSAYIINLGFPILFFNSPFLDSHQMRTTQWDNNDGSK